MVVVEIIQLAMVEIVAEGTAEEENVVKVGMINTLPLLTIPLLIPWSDSVRGLGRVIDVYLP
jgi:hypothetical protein